MKKYVLVFNNLLKSLHDDNMVLAGTNALKYHGLKMSRESNDLDVVLFKPTEKQLLILRNLTLISDQKKFRISDNDKIQDEHYPLDNLILKFKKDEMNIDIHLSNEECPNDLLYFHCDEIELNFKVQNIALNIEAKNSYALRNQDGLKFYRRIKDSEDLQDLKNSNFNL